MAYLATSQKAAKIAIAILGVLVLAQTASYTAIYWGMWADANDFNDLAGSDDAYNQCASLNADFNTKWSVLLAYNSIFYLILSICTVLIILGSFFWPLACCGMIGHCCGVIPHLACLIVTGVFRFSEDGKACAEEGAAGASMFTEHGDKIQALFLAQCILYCFFSCCMGCLVQVGMMSGMLKGMSAAQSAH